MKIDFSQIILDLSGNPIPRHLTADPKGPTTTWTLGAICADILMAPVPGVPANERTGADIVDRFALALKLNEGGEKEITVDQVAKIRKRLVDCGYHDLMVARVMTMTEGK
jgi:hypothetical protein